MSACALASQESASGLRRRREQSLQMQRSRPIVQRAIRSPRPLLGRTIPTEFDIVAIWVIDVDGQAHSIISGILDGNAGLTHPAHRMCQGRLGWKPQPVVVESRSFCWRGTLLSWDGS